MTQINSTHKEILDASDSNHIGSLVHYGIYESTLFLSEIYEKLQFEHN